MKRNIKLAVLLLTFASCVIGFTACSQNSNDEIKDSESGLTFLFNEEKNCYRVVDCDEELTEAVIPSEFRGRSVTSIGKKAFYERSSLTSVIIPDTITSIGDKAFSKCSSLTDITIPNSVMSIGKNAFGNCYKLKNVNYTGTVDQWVQINFKDTYSCPLWYSKKLCINNKLLTEINITTATKINDYAFRGLDGLTSVTIGNDVTSIGDSAFQYCEKLTNLTIGNGVSRVGSYAFSGCNGLTNVIIPNNVTSIEDYAFFCCNSLISIEIPNSVTAIGYMAFDGCDGLQYNEYDNALYLGNATNEYLYLARVKSIDITIIGCVINGNCKFIESSLFKFCYNLTNVTFEKPNGWYVVESSTATSGIDLDLSDAEQNATYLKFTYNDYYWKRK